MKDNETTEWSWFVFKLMRFPRESRGIGGRLLICPLTNKLEGVRITIGKSDFLFQFLSNNFEIRNGPYFGDRIIELKGMKFEKQTMPTVAKDIGWMEDLHVTLEGMAIDANKITEKRKENK